MNCCRQFGLEVNPNFDWLPIAYHGRVSSIGVSGQQVYRPMGQYRADEGSAPMYGPCQRLDYELEVGAVIGIGNARGTPIPLAKAQQHIFGLCLLTDWSARDIQTWEMQPLGPFLAKNFATTLSPWIVTSEALLPYRTGWTRAPERPQPLDYLRSADNAATGRLRHPTWRFRYSARASNTGQAIAHADPYQLPTPVLDAEPDDCSPHHGRLQSSEWRPAGQRHDLRPHTG
ncbi:fumarylacetoacetate hydrolase family protein [Cupriavidus basilensis]